MSTWIAPRADLFAEHYALKYVDPEPGELEFVRRRVAEGGEPVLELGCGTGRMLVPLVERGLDLVGIDVSPAMLARCRHACEAKGLTIDLHVQAMEALELPRTFGTIFLGSCGLGVLIDEVAVGETFRRVFDHLRPGGVFSLEIQTPAAAKRSQEQAGLWTGQWHETEDGALLVVRSVHTYDPEAHRRSSVMIFERYVDGRLAETEAHEVTMRFWEAEPVVRMLGDAGFVDVATRKVFTDDEPAGESDWLAIWGRRPPR